MRCWPAPPSKISNLGYIFRMSVLELLSIPAGTGKERMNGFSLCRFFWIIYFFFAFESDEADVKIWCKIYTINSKISTDPKSHQGQANPPTLTKFKMPCWLWGCSLVFGLLRGSFPIFQWCCPYLRVRGRLADASHPAVWLGTWSCRPKAPPQCLHTTGMWEFCFRGFPT